MNFELSSDPAIISATTLPRLASGFRDQANGAFAYVGTNGYSWSASVTGGNGYFLNFNNTNVNPRNENNRARGIPVRCISAFTVGSFLFF